MNNVESLLAKATVSRDPEFSAETLETENGNLPEE